MNSLLSSAAGWDVISIFGTAMLVLFITVSMKYWTKAYLFGPSSQATKAEKRAVSFDCARVGIDLSILGLGTYLAVTQLALEKNIPVAVTTLHKYNAAIVLTQTLLLILAGIATTVTDSSVKRFWSGILIPVGLGWVSIWISATVFYHILLNG
jgi:predicted membrane channel-forming protein YqfA (hemolysin III family)